MSAKPPWRRFRFVGRWAGRYHWQSVGRAPGDSRVEIVSCPVDWYWS